MPILSIIVNITCELGLAHGGYGIREEIAKKYGLEIEPKPDAILRLGFYIVSGE